MKSKILNVLSILFGVLFIVFGLNKFFHFIPMPEEVPEALANLMAAMMTFGWLMPLVAFIEILGGLLFIFPKFRALGAIVIFPVMVGILLTHTITDTEGLPMALILSIINFWVIIDNKDKYLPMIQ